MCGTGHTDDIMRSYEEKRCEVMNKATAAPEGKYMFARLNTNSILTFLVVKHKPSVNISTKLPFSI